MANKLTIISQPLHGQHNHNYHPTSPWPIYSQLSPNLSMANILTIITQPHHGQQTHNYHAVSSPGCTHDCPSTNTTTTPQCSQYHPWIPKYYFTRGLSLFGNVWFGCTEFAETKNNLSKCNFQCLTLKSVLLVLIHKNMPWLWLVCISVDLPWIL